MSIQRRDVAGLDLSDVTTGESLDAVTPGEVLRIEFMEPLRLSARALARDLQVPANRITEIIRGERVVTAETALLLADRLGTTAEFWLNLQMAHDLEVARAQKRTVTGSKHPSSQPSSRSLFKNANPRIR
jgi:addiction module HigA family antidote